MKKFTKPVSTTEQKKKAGRPTRYETGLVRQELRLRPGVKDGVKKIATEQRVSFSQYVDEVLFNVVALDAASKEDQENVEKN